MVIELTGVIGIMLPWLTPLVIVPTIALIGLSLFEEAASTARQWALPTVRIGAVLGMFAGTLASVLESELDYGMSNLSTFIHQEIFYPWIILIYGITIPKWFNGHPGTIDIGNDVANQLITVILSTSVFVGRLISLVLDNSIPGDTINNSIQGAIIVASIFEIVIGLSGVIGIILQWLTPLVIVPTISLIGLSLFEEAASTASKNWGISFMTILLLVLFSQYLENINIPGCSYSRERGWKIEKLPVFKLFPVILTVVTAWVICFILTAADALGPTNSARTDLRVQTMYSSPWFRFPYPGQWGLPTVTISSVLGMFAGILASVLKSVGDYYACARLACEPFPPTGAINRGIFAEGISCTISGICGSACGMTSYSQNIGAIGITKVASRRVIQYGAVTMMIFAVLGKFGAF
ncbi:solute carrier family 23 member 2-like [Tachypleus tridentatus]|uniref:solute carrier family 23 member 2-like n=1 Tax=Tachypleus tridentatus TaxID=6853 RepID=UPI003FD438E3